MNWEYTHLAMAAGAGMLDQLRDEATAYRKSRELREEERARSARALRDRLAKGHAALTSLWSRFRRPQEPSHRPPQLISRP